MSTRDKDRVCDLPSIILNDLNRREEEIPGTSSSTFHKPLTSLSTAPPYPPPPDPKDRPSRADVALCGNRVHGFMSELKQVGSDLAQKINLLTDIDEELATALHRLETQEEEISQYRQQMQKLESELKAKHHRVRELERKVNEQNGHSRDAIKQAMSEAEESKGRAKQLEDLLEEQKNTHSELNQRIESLKTKLRGSEKSAHYYRSLNESLNKTLESKRKIIEDLQVQSQKYLERAVEYERVKMNQKYLEHSDPEEQLQAAKLMLKERDFELAQLWENFTVLENAVAENLQEVGVGGGRRKESTKEAVKQNHYQHVEPCCSDWCNMRAPEQQLVMTGGGGGCTSPVGFGGGSKREKFEEVERNLQNIQKKITQLKKAHGGGGGGGGHQQQLQGRNYCKPAAVSCGGSVDDNYSCTCGK